MPDEIPQPWFENEDLWEVLEPVIFGPQTWVAAGAEVVSAVTLLDAAPGAHILDMPCGLGRHTVELLKSGFRVTGVDRTRRFLDQARARCAGFGDRAELVMGDMREFRRPAAFDAAINLFTSFGYFKDPADDRRVLDGFFASLRPGGRLLLDMVGKEFVARNFREREWRRINGRTILLEERTLAPDWSWIDNTWIVLRDDERLEHRFGHRLYAASELGALLRAAGFDDVRIFGSIAGAPFDTAARRLVAVATRPVGR